MAIGAAIVGAAFLLLAGLTRFHAAGPAPWPWLALFFAILTFGELFILPTGLGLFARLAPAGHGATTVAAWYLATFAGSLAGGAVGTLWTEIPRAGFFAMLAMIAGAASLLLWSCDTLEQHVQADRSKSAEPA